MKLDNVLHMSNKNPLYESISRFDLKYSFIAGITEDLHINCFTYINEIRQNMHKYHTKNIFGPNARVNNPKSVNLYDIGKALSQSMIPLAKTTGIVGGLVYLLTQ